MSEEEKQKRRKALLKHWHRRTDGVKKTKSNLRENAIHAWLRTTETLTENIILNTFATIRRNLEKLILSTMRGRSGTEDTITTNLHLMNTYK